MKIKPMAILLTMLAGWINCQQTDIVEYLSMMVDSLNSKSAGKLE